MSEAWRLFIGGGDPRPDVQIPPAPPWRFFASETADPEEQPIHYTDPYWDRARRYCASPDVIDPVNAALRLRRPLLVEGPPGSGKTSLIYRVAYELGLGPVLEWPVNSRTKLRDGLYEYDALARLQAHQLNRDEANDAGLFITLRSLGTALLPSERPRALLIDEIDKADPDLPNDLLNVFEEGRFEILELLRERVGSSTVRRLGPAGASTTAVITDGTVRCTEFPFVVLTSNGEREFPPAFLRRCIRVRLPEPGPEQLERVVAAHLGIELASRYRSKIETFAQQQIATRATDQLLNAIFLVHGAADLTEDARSRVEATVLQAIHGS